MILHTLHVGNETQNLRFLLLGFGLALVESVLVICLHLHFGTAMLMPLYIARKVLLYFTGTPS